MGFNNPLTGLNGSLIYPQIKSPDFNLGAQTGWAILKNGNAYFFNVVATGTITATAFIGTDFVINSSGEFFYSGTPANGNLILSLANTSGTDAQGNTYVAGLGIYTASTNIGSWNATGFKILNTASSLNGTLSVTPNGTTGISPVLSLNTGENVSSTTAHIEAQYQGALSADALSFVGPVTTADADASQILLSIIGAAAGAPGSATGQFLWRDTPSGQSVLGQWDNNGFHIYMGSINGVQPGTGTPPIAETWHTAALTASFTNNGAADAPPRYRIEPVGSGSVVRLDGTVVVNVAAVPGATTMFTLPVGYRPATRKRFTGDTNFVGATVGMTLVQVASTGVVTCGPNGTTAEQLVLDGMTFPLD